MANTGNEVSASDSVSEILLKEQANKNDGGNKPPTYETLFSNTENPIQVHEQSQSRYQNIGLGIYRGYEYRLNSNKIIEIEIDLDSEMKLSRRELRVLLLHEFRLGLKATKATSNICGTMGKDVLSIRTAQHWFHRFKNGNFELDDLPHTGRPLEVDMDLLKQLIEQDPHLTTRCLAERLGCSHITVETHLHELDKTWKYGVWIPHELSPIQLQQRVDACVELRTSHRNYQWLHNLITGDEK
ncbi:unnamed protein product [Rotaria magnacalcarata]|uniref:Mos1 transposase HTH domain-containing protein n=3 Tax=Rotaria magnacalcarata TaxID=392030 RepID=A0A815HJM5_9BILA|nr:unnamed protein product [Rotaria magnacalcarata]